MSEPSDPTRSMDLDRTQELQAPLPPPVPETRIPDEPTWATVPAQEFPPAPDTQVLDPAAPVPVGSVMGPQPGWDHGTPALSGSAAPGPARGPGWAAVLLIAGLATLLAGLGGGVLGGWLASNGYLNTSFWARTSPTVDGPAPTAGAGATTRPEGSVANIAAKAMPSIVTIKVTADSGSGTGSGWVLDQQGHVVTNNHVVAAAANGGTITVVLSNGKHSDATIVGRDASYDLAVLKVDRADLTPLPIGDSGTVVVGDPVIAVGAPLGLESTVTTGIVSALNRPVAAGDSTDTSYINAIQTDAAINPGNSGGPLLNLAGQVIGVNSAIATAPGTGTNGGAGSIGVGFAIPSAQVTKTVEQLIRTGKAVHPVIGVYLDRRYDGEGVKILEEAAGGQPAITAGGPAAKAGLKPGDVILALNGRPMTSPDALVVGIRSLDVGQSVTLTVRRGTEQLDVKMVLEAANN